MVEDGDVPSFEEICGELPEPEYRELREHVIEEQKHLVRRGVLNDIHFPAQYKERDSGLRSQEDSDETSSGLDSNFR